MDNLYQILKLWHIISFVFMSIPLFNLIVVNERALMGSSFNFGKDKMIQKHNLKHGIKKHQKLFGLLQVI
jgi:hypothetical protein